MQLKKAIGRAETMRQGFVEACEWPQHFGGHPDLIGWWWEKKVEYFQVCAHPPAAWPLT